MKSSFREHIENSHKTTTYVSAEYLPINRNVNPKGNYTDSLLEREYNFPVTYELRRSYENTRDTPVKALGSVYFDTKIVPTNIMFTASLERKGRGGESDSNPSFRGNSSLFFRI